jgi:hypothetical protein
MRLALYNQLVSKSGLPVYNRSDEVVNPKVAPGELKQYIVIWEEDNTFSNINQGEYYFRVAVHYPPGDIDNVDDKITKLTEWFKDPVSVGVPLKYFQFIPGEISGENKNDDGTISKDRLLTIPAWG